MFCNSCGTQRRADLKFCTNCGAAGEERQPQGYSQPSGQAYSQPDYSQPSYPKPDYSQQNAYSGYPQSGEGYSGAAQPGYPQNNQQASYPQQAAYSDYSQGGSYSGYPQSSQYQAYQPAHSPATPAAKPKKKGKAKFIVAASILALLLTGGVVFGAVIYNNPSLAVSRAMGNMPGEFSQRLATSPLQAFEMLFDTIESGTVNVSFEYRNEWWDDWWGSGGSTNSRGDFSLASDASAGAYALTGNVQVDNNSNFNFAAYINRDRVAVGSPQFSSNYYGFRFDTFRRDFRPYGQNVLHMSNSEMDMVADIVEEIGSLLRRSGDSAADQLEPYVDAFTSFLLAAQSGSERNVDVWVGLQAISTRRVDYVITTSDLANLLDTWIDILEWDENFRGVLDSNPFYGGMMGADVYDSMIREFRDGVREFRRNVQGSIVLSFYIGSGNRLVQISIDSTLFSYGDRAQIIMTLNFGASATDTWTFTASFIEPYWGTQTYRAIWEIDSDRGRHVNRMSFYGDNDSVLRVMSDWDPASGAFAFSYEEYRERWDWERGGWFAEWQSDELFRGNFTTTGQNFRLRFVHEDFWDWGDGWDETSFTLEISTDQNANTGSNISFINIDQWGQTFYDRLSDFAWEMGW